MIKPGTAEWWSNLVTLIIFSYCLGILGIDRFFKGDIALGIIKLITLGACGVWYIVDICLFTYRMGVSGQWAKATDTALNPP